MILAAVTVLALILGLTVPLRWGLAGFLGAVLVLFAAHFAALTAMGFEGLPLSESLLLFEGSMTAYLSFNAQVAYRAFAVPLLVLACLVIWRTRRGQI